MSMLIAWLLAATGAAPTVPVEIVSGASAATPGGAVDIGVVLSLPDGWHTYWDGLNDTGFPPRLVWDLPPGFTAGAPIWPAPHRHVSAGGILDHVLAGEVVAVVPIAAPRDLAPGATVALVCRVEWLVCRDICVPGRSEASISLAVVAPDDVLENPRGAGLIAAARTQQARPLPADGGQVRWRRNGGIVTIESPGAERLAFYPRADSAHPADLLRSGETAGERLVLEIRPQDVGRAVRGVLAVHAAGSPVVDHWELEIPAEEAP